MEQSTTVKYVAHRPFTADQPTEIEWKTAILRDNQDATITNCNDRIYVECNNPPVDFGEVTFSAVDNIPPGPTAIITRNDYIRYTVVRKKGDKVTTREVIVNVWDL